MDPTTSGAIGGSIIATVIILLTKFIMDYGNLKHKQKTEVETNAVVVMQNQVTHMQNEILLNRQDLAKLTEALRVSEHHRIQLEVEVTYLREELDRIKKREQGK